MHLDKNLEAIIKNMLDAACIVDVKKQKVSCCNEALLFLTGCENLDELNQLILGCPERFNFRNAHTKESLLRSEIPFNQALKGEKTIKEVINRNIKTNKDVYIRYAVSPILENEQVVRSIITCTDITEKIKTEKKLNETLHELKNFNTEMEAFTYAVSHDLKSPLNSIQGLASLVLKSTESIITPTDKHLLSLILNSSKKLDKLINQLLELSNLRQKELNNQEVNLQELASLIIENYQFSSSNVTPEVIIQDELKAYGDESLLHSVMQNLITNAIKYSRKSGAPKVEIGSREKEGELIYFVKDNGIGFDMKKADDLFKPFKRLHPHSDFDGTGIGLSTVKKIIERHGGKIWAESAPNKGATFFFTLPNVRNLNLKTKTTMTKAPKNYQNKISA